MTRRGPATSTDGGRREALHGLARTAEVLTGHALSSEAVDRFSRYLDLLVAWNLTQRLTAFHSPVDIVRGLFADSLLFWELLPPRPLTMVDIGAGAGIPGVPLRIVDPGIDLTLIESRRKRVSFLRAVCRELSLEGGISVFEGRAEALRAQITESKGEFDVAVARSVGPFEELAPVALGYLKPQGILIASGPPPDKPERALHKQTSGFEVKCEVREFPLLGLKRTFLVVSRP